MLKVILTKGLPGSGKTTWAKKQLAENKHQYKRVNKDDLRRMLDNSQWSGSCESFILDIRDKIILEALKNGKHVIVDDTNLHPKHEEHIQQLIKDKAILEIKDFTDVPIEDCIANDLQRLDSVGEKTIQRMHRDFLANKIIKAPDCNPLLKTIIICDLDGTLCDNSHRNPYNASTCENDLLNKPVFDVIQGKDVIFVSGRHEKYRPQTEKFLNKHNIKYITLLMRKDDDNRKDNIIKQEIYETHIKDKYNVLFILDDRQRVVDMWRKNGLTCFQVAEGNF